MEHDPQTAHDARADVLAHTARNARDVRDADDILDEILALAQGLPDSLRAHIMRALEDAGHVGDDLTARYPVSAPASPSPQATAQAEDRERRARAPGARPGSPGDTTPPPPGTPGTGSGGSTTTPPASTPKP